MNRLLTFLLLACAPTLALADPFSAIAAIGSAIGSATAGMTLLSGMTMLGTTLSVVGAVTGNKKLAKFGGIMGLAGGLGSLLKAGMEAAATSAGTQQLAQSAAGVAPAQELANEAAQAALEASSAAGSGAGAAAALSPIDALTQAQNAGLGVEDLGVAKPAVPPGADAAAGPLSQTSSIDNPSPVRDALRKLEAATAPPSQDASLLDRLALGIKNNKEVVKLGAGLVSGAMQGRQKRELLKDEEAAMIRQQQRYSDSVKGIAPAGQFINPGADVTNVPTRDPMRYVPRRGLVAGRAPGG
jgi:hypothetical protein